MKEITIRIPDDSLIALKLSTDEAGDTLRMMAAVKLYELGKLSSGAAAHLAGIPRVVFLSRLSDYNVAVLNLTEEDIERETRLA